MSPIAKKMPFDATVTADSGWERPSPTTASTTGGQRTVREPTRPP